MKILGFFFVLLSGIIFFVGVSMVECLWGIYLKFNILSIYGVEYSMSFWLDWMSVLYVFVIMYISGSVYVFSEVYLESEYKIRFCLILFFFVLSMFLLVVGGDMMTLFLGWDGLGVTSFLLVVFYQNYRCLNSGMITFVMNRIGDVFMMLSIGLMFSFGSMSLLNLGIGNMFYLVCLIMFLASLTKSAQFPFSAWLPAAMAAPTPVSALVHSSTLVTAGVYLLCRMEFLGCFLNYKFLMYVSLLTLLFSSVMACFEFDLKKIIALSTLSQLGMMMFSISVGLWKVGYFHMISHAMFKSMLFLCGGSMIFYLLHNQDLRFYGLGKLSSFVVKVGFCVSLMSLCGFPFLSGFYSKDLVIEMWMMGEISVFFLLLFVFSLCLTVVYSIRLLSLCYSLVFKFPLVIGFFENWMMNFSVILLMFFSVICGVVFQYLLFSEGELIMVGDCKMVGVVVLIVGFFFFIIWMNLMSKVFSVNWFLFCDYFFLFSLSGNVNLVILKIFSMTDESEKIWNELVGPVGVVKVVRFFSLNLNKLIDLSLVVLLLSFLVFLVV